MTDDRFERYYRVLEVSPGASLQELERAYRLLRRIYREPMSAAAVPGMREFSDARRQEILDEIEEAYAVLKEQFKVTRQALQSRTPVEVPDQPITGAVLRQMREEMQIPLSEMAEKTNIRTTYLEALEAERFDVLPPAAVYVRGFVRAYLEFLGLTRSDLVDQYMARYRETMGESGA